MSVSTEEMRQYMLERRVGGTDYIDAAPNDPVLIQAEQDGYAVREDGRWRGLGEIQPGERRTVRHSDGHLGVVRRCPMTRYALLRLAAGWSRLWVG